MPPVVPGSKCTPPSPCEMAGSSSSISTYRFRRPPVDQREKTRVGLAYCSSGSTVVFGGDTKSFDVVVCADGAGTLEYHGVKRETGDGIRLPACEGSSRRYLASHGESRYVVDAVLDTAGSTSVQVYDPSDELIVDDVFLGVVGAYRHDLASC